MNTTSIFVELLIGGIQASIWVALLALSFWNYNSILSILPQLEKWQTLVTVMVFAVWYTLGILVDQLSMIVISMLNPIYWLGQLTVVSNKLKWSMGNTRTFHLEIIIQQNKVIEYLALYRSRSQILRVTTFNLFLTIVPAVLFVVFNCSLLGCASYRAIIVLYIIGIGMILLLITSTLFVLQEVAYIERVTKFKDILTKRENKTSEQDLEIVEKIRRTKK